MVNCWCKDLHLICFRKSWERHYSLSTLLLYQINVNFTVCGYWLLKNLEKKKSNKFNSVQIEVSFLPNISSFPQYRLIKFVFYLYIRPGRINEILRYLTLNVFKTGSLWQEKTGSSSLLFYTLPPKTQLKKTFIPKCFHTTV